jgi:hypothetical protein
MWVGVDSLTGEGGNRGVAEPGFAHGSVGRVCRIVLRILSTCNPVGCSSRKETIHRNSDPLSLHRAAWRSATTHPNLMGAAYARRSSSRMLFYKMLIRVSNMVGVNPFFIESIRPVPLARFRHTSIYQYVCNVNTLRP